MDVGRTSMLLTTFSTPSIRLTEFSASDLRVGRTTWPGVAAPANIEKTSGSESTATNSDFFIVIDLADVLISQGNPDFCTALKTLKRPCKLLSIFQMGADRSVRPTRSGFRSSTAFPEAFDQQVEHGNDEQIQDGAHDHASEDGGADGVAAIFSCAAGGHQWDHAENEGEGGHQDGAQADAGGFDRGIQDGH